MTTATTLAVNAGAGLARCAAAALGNALHRWWRHARDRRHIMQLDDHLLRDVGLTREEVVRGILPPLRNR